MAERASLSRNLLGDLLSERQVLVADGGMGTSLFELGLTSGSSPELWNLERPEIIAGVQRAFVDAGADIILTNTFGANRERLALHDAADRVVEINTAAASIARSVAGEVVRDVVVAGSIGPTGSLFEPLGSLTPERARDLFAEQAAALAAAGCDVLWIETMSALDELGAAVEGAATTRLPIVTTMSFDTNGHTMMGVAPAALAEWWQQASRSPAAIGANCGLGPGEAVLAAGEVAQADPQAVVIAKGNCGIPEFQGTELHYPADPQVMDEYAQLALDAGARIVGACCGSTPDHIRRIRKVVNSYEPGESPTRESIGELVGLDGSPERISPLNPNARRARRRRR